MDENTKFHVIMACTLDCGIGKYGKLPWHIPRDLEYFRKITLSTTIPSKQNMVIMGRKTWESLPKKPLPGRKNVVVTRQSIEGVECVSSFEAALKIATRTPVIENIFVIGGAQLYNEAMKHPLCDTLYITMVNHDFACDTFFDSSVMKNYKLVDLSDVQTHQGVEYSFAIFKHHRESSL